MTTIVSIAITASLAVFALLSSLFSLFLVWRRPETPPDVSNLQSAYESLRLSQLDIIERVETWMKRESVRRARESRQEAPSPQGELPVDPRALKQALRKRVITGGR